MSISTTRFALAFAFVGLAAACGSSSDTPSDAATADAAVADAPPDPEDPACREPITIAPDPGAEAAAIAELAALSPTATLTWAPVRGTISATAGLVVPLPACTGSANAFELLLDVLEQHPALFQIDRREWDESELPCSHILASGFNTLVIRRTKYGPYALDNDVFFAVADVQDGGVVLRNFGGQYVPRPSEAVLATLASCPDRSEAALAAELRATPFNYQVFAPPPAPICEAANVGAYTATAADVLTFHPAVLARWDETDVLTIHRQRDATLLVAEANHTPELLRSDANCPDELNRPRVGWIRSFNTITGEVLYDHANPDPYCIVCLHGSPHGAPARPRDPAAP